VPAVYGRNATVFLLYIFVSRDISQRTFALLRPSISGTTVLMGSLPFLFLLLYVRSFPVLPHGFPGDSPSISRP